MNVDRFREITGCYRSLRVGVIGDFFLDRYLEIDARRSEKSIETGLEVYNVVNVRSQPGAAGTIVNNLVSLGIGEIYPVGFCGDDGEGYELRRALAAQSGLNLKHFVTSPSRRTFVYCKPLLIERDHAPRELNRFDSKNWTPTPLEMQHDFAARVADLSREVDVLLLMDQVDLADTGVVTRPVLNAAHTALLQRKNDLVVLADSRRGLREYPPLAFKMNAVELARMCNASTDDLATVKVLAGELAERNGQPVFVTLAEQGIVGAGRDRVLHHAPAHPLRGPIDIVGAGDAVTANLAAALASGATVSEALDLAMAAASLVIHQLGTTGTATISEIAALLQRHAIR
jgi:rfaE bifunctional protein kinase chain/domain